MSASSTPLLIFVNMCAHYISCYNVNVYFCNKLLNKLMPVDITYYAVFSVQQIYKRRVRLLEKGIRDRRHYTELILVELASCQCQREKFNAQPEMYIIRYLVV